MPFQFSIQQATLLLLPLLALQASILGDLIEEDPESKLLSISERPFAYAANAGWISLSPTSASNIIANESYLSGYLYGANIGWIHLGESPANDQNFSNESPTDFGINRDPIGNLSGYAYSGNIGWINFGWAETNDPNRPRIDPESKKLLGFAYSANIGWILLGTDFPVAFREGDSDGDSMLDQWELEQFGDLVSSGIGSDNDGDGQTDASEAIAGSDPFDAESFFRILSFAFGDGFASLTIEFTTHADRLYRIETMDQTSGEWTDIGLGEIEHDSNGTTTRTFNISIEAAVLFRVAVSGTN